MSRNGSRDFIIRRWEQKCRLFSATWTTAERLPDLENCFTRQATIKRISPKSKTFIVSSRPAIRKNQALTKFEHLRFTLCRSLNRIFFQYLSSEHRQIMRNPLKKITLV